MKSAQPTAPGGGQGDPGAGWVWDCRAMQTGTILNEWRRPGPTRRQRNADVVIGVAVAALALFNLTLSRSVGIFFTDASPAAVEQALWSLGVTLPLIWRRRWPELTLLLIAVAFIGGQARGSQEQQLSSGALFAAIYAAGAWGRDRRRARWLRAVVIAAMFGWLAVAWLLAYDEALPAGGPPGASGDIPPLIAAIVNGILINVLFFGFAYLFGETAWLSVRRQHQLEVQAQELRRAQADAEEQAVFGERVRIARELHDVVAHHVSVMGVQAAAGRRALDKDLGKARTALAAVEQSARTAVDELRRMLGALRAPGTEAGPDDTPAAAGVDRVGDMVDRVREAGLDAQYAVYGEPVAVPESVSQAAYRIAQEAVTNTLKHAAASTIDVRIRYLANELEVDVADDGRGGATPGGGMGLIGMRERVAVHDGTLEVGPRSDGGFRVRARLPLQHGARETVA